MEFLQKLKPMRVVLLLCALLLIVLRPDPGTAINYEGIDVFLTLLIPVLTPIFFMLLLLDAIIASIWRSQTSGEERKRYNMIRTLDLTFAVCMLGYWIPYIRALA